MARKPSPRHLTHAGLALMNILWEHGPATVQMVVDRLPAGRRRQREPSRTTIPATLFRGVLALSAVAAHVRRRDVWTLLLSEIALLPAALHPVAGVLRRKLAEASELACDEQAAAETGSRPDCAQRLPGLCIDDAGILERRVRALLRPRTPFHLRLRHKAAAALIALLSSAAIAGPAQAVYLRVSVLPRPVVSSYLVPALPPPPPPPGGRR